MRAPAARCPHGGGRDGRLRSQDHRGYCKACAPRTLVLLSEPGGCPGRCPHCEATPPGWQRGADLGRCFYCGQWWERRVAVAGGVA
jgi:hypothetical protein